MTLSQTITMAYDLSIDGFINGEKFTRDRFINQVKSLMRDSDSYIFQIALPDGWWFCKITRGNWGYDLIVPDNREQESRLLDKLFHR